MAQADIYYQKQIVAYFNCCLQYKEMYPKKKVEQKKLGCKVHQNFISIMTSIVSLDSVGEMKSHNCRPL